MVESQNVDTQLWVDCDSSAAASARPGNGYEGRRSVQDVCYLSVPSPHEEVWTPWRTDLPSEVNCAEGRGAVRIFDKVIDLLRTKDSGFLGRTKG